MKRKLWLGIAGIFLLLLVFPGSATAQTQNQVQLTAIAGLDGFCKNNTWIPVYATLENNGADLEGELEVRVSRQSGGTVSAYAATVTLPTNSRKAIRLNVYPEGIISQVRVSFVVDGQRAATTVTRLNCLREAALLTGVVAASPSAYNILGDIPLSNNNSAYVAQLDSLSLPDNVQGLQPLDVLLFSDVDTGALSEAQRNAIEQWVGLGGKLIVTGGSSWQKTAAGLQALLPFQPENSITLSDLEGLQNFDEEEVLDGREVIIATGQTLDNSHVLASQDNHPLIVTRPFGYGKVLYLAVDPAVAPLRSWDGMLAVYDSYIKQAIDQPVWVKGFQNWDYAESAAGTFINLGLPSTFFICGFLAVYVLAVGPLNYLVLRMLKKRELAWVSIPVFVISFTLLAFILGGQIRGNQAQLNRLAVVQMDADSDTAYVNGLVSIFSPRRTNYDLTIGQDFTAHAIPLSYGTSEGDWEFRKGTTETVIPDIRLESGGVRAVAVEGEIPAPEFDYDLSISISGQDAYLTGTITNKSGFKLVDAVLLYPGGDLVISDFVNNKTEQINVQLSKAELSSNAGNGTNPFSLGVPTYYGYYSNDTLEAIVQTTYYYDDSTAFQRFNLVNALLGANEAANGRGGGFYLTGWAETDPIPASLNQASRPQDTSLYLVSFSPIYEHQVSQQVYPPAFFTWEVIDTAGADYRVISPYNMSLNGERYALRFMLSPQVSYEQVSDLIFHLEGPSYTSINFTIYFWDFELETWSPQQISTWGDHAIHDPSRYVGPGGDVRVRIDDQNYSNLQIDRCDFTLIVE
ncbi:MAG: hypothetical protein JXB38_22775 [Anaerolineales bacterium]|nr:hypothetical protein [Anaerolineales bacterium]